MLTLDALRAFYPIAGGLERSLLPLPSHNCIYVKNPKAGCSTITLLLDRIHTGEHDYLPAPITDLHFTHRLPRPSDIGWDRLVEMLDGAAYRFTFVRDPLARAESAWSDKLSGREKFYGPRLARAQRVLGLPKDPDRPVSFEQFVDLLELQDPLVMDRHWRPQHINLMHPLVTYDFIGRLDNFERDLAVVREATGMPPVAAPAVNTQRRHDMASEYEGRPDLVRRVQAIYATDLELFGY